jgi:hypothetical protein
VPSDLVRVAHAFLQPSRRTVIEVTPKEPA